MKRKKVIRTPAFKHTAKRLLERYGLNLAPIEHRQLSKAIRESNGRTCVERISNTRTIHRLPFKGKEILAVYSHTARGVITVLPGDKQ